MPIYQINITEISTTCPSGAYGLPSHVLLTSFPVGDMSSLLQSGVQFQPENSWLLQE